MRAFLPPYVVQCPHCGAGLRSANIPLPTPDRALLVHDETYGSKGCPHAGKSYWLPLTFIELEQADIPEMP